MFDVKDLLDKVGKDEEVLQDYINQKMKSDSYLNDEEILKYKFTEEDNKVVELFDRILQGENIPGFNFNDFLATPQAKVLVPKVVIGTMKKAADPMYLASSFYKKVRFKSGQALMFPEIGVMRAHDIAEGQEIECGVSVA